MAFFLLLSSYNLGIPSAPRAGAREHIGAPPAPPRAVRCCDLARSRGEASASSSSLASALPPAPPRAGGHFLKVAPSLSAAVCTYMSSEPRLCDR